MPTNDDVDPGDTLPAATELIYIASADELAVILDIMERGRLSTYNAVLRVAIGRLADQMDVPVPAGAFQLKRLRGQS